MKLENENKIEMENKIKVSRNGNRRKWKCRENENRK
jgi:hypothetical protein